jgi:MoaA/NifB/PqqE/SkfB family radical SAM enzyme
MANVIKSISPNTSVNLVSNGILFDDKKAQGLKEAGITLIQFSLDGISDFSYDLIRNSNGKLHKVLEAIDIAIEAGLVNRRGKS